MTRLTVNGKRLEVDVPSDKPLLWVIREDLDLTGTKFGCGVGQCGACTVHLDGVAVRSCITPLSAVAGRSVTTIEAMARTPIGRAVQAAWIAEEVPQCGYCQSGQVLAAVFLLQNPAPHRRRHRSGDVRQHLPVRHLRSDSARHPSGGRNTEGEIACQRRR